ncbi:MAG: hypothetical protein HYX67_15620, partial [Candidatus Melainabacteria bacterium]|nr:hypothetical protein [Candidatus Melainabacteria bacterium]
KASIDGCAFDHIFVYFGRPSQADIFFEEDGVFNEFANLRNSPGKALIIHSITENVNRGSGWGVLIGSVQPTMRTYFDNINKMVMLSSQEMMQLNQMHKVPDFLLPILETGIIPDHPGVYQADRGLVYPHPNDRGSLNHG